MRYTIDDIVSRVQRLPMPNAAAMQVIRLCTDPEIKFARLVDAISTDQSLTAQILRIANSSYFNYPRTIYTIDRALVLLGTSLLKDIAVSLAFHSFCKGLSSTQQGFFEILWRHALETAIICQTLAPKFAPASGDILYVGGLLHDIGKLAEIHIIPDIFHRFETQSRQKNQRLYEIEQQEFNFHHGDVGGILIDHWNLPPALVKMVRFHHYPGDFSATADEYRLVQTVYLGNILAHFIQQESAMLDTIHQYDPNFTHFFPMDQRELTELMNHTREAINRKRFLMEIYH